MTAKRERAEGRMEHTIRTRDGGFKRLKYARKQAIQLCCTECLGWEDDPKDCTSIHCPLFPFRGRTMASQRARGEQDGD